MPDNNIETLTVELEANYDKLLRQTKEGVDKAEKELDKLSDAPEKSLGGFQQLGSYLSGQFLQIITGIGAAFAAAFAVQNLIGFIQNLGRAAIDASAQFETFRVQFETLLGSASAAQERIQELAKFGQKTPFELDEIVSADRLLQTFGGTILATGENLRRVGDSAAAVNANFQEVAFWTGRLYAAIQSGRPFGEAAARLSELGILSGDVRLKMEDLQKAGADGTEIWEVYAETIDTRFAGAMDRLSKTFQGVMSNIADFQSMLLREGGQSFFEGLRQDAIDFYDVINEPENTAALTDLARAFGEIANQLREAITGPLLESLKDIDAQKLEQLALSLESFAKAIGQLAGTDTTNLNGMIDAIKGLVDAATGLANVVSTLKEWSLVVSGIKPLQDVFGEIPMPLFELLKLLGNINEQTKELETTGSHALKALQQGAQDATDRNKELDESVEEVDTTLADMLDNLATGFQDAVADRAEKVEALEADHGEKMAGITEDYKQKQADIIEERDKDIANLEKELAQKREDIAEQTAEALEDLEKDIAKKRADIAEKTAEALAELEESTNDQIASLREDAQQDEKRETEDHQRDMQALQDQYLYDLENAVTARDARAIVDLRRRNEKEKREKQETFETDEERRQEDLENQVREVEEAEDDKRREILANQAKELADLEEYEAERRQEIADSQAEQLEKLAEYEAEKRTAIEESTQEQLARAEEQYQEQVARENERYEERKTALDEALKKRLEDVAKELADEKAINEEGAQAILETLNKFFGVGGDIDQLMEDFAARRKQKLTIQLGFEQISQGGSGGTGQGQGAHPGAIPGFQFGGIVPGPMGRPRLIMAHGGEEVVPVNEVARLNAMRNAMRISAGNNELRVKLDISGSAPPGIRGGEVEMMAGVVVRALKDAGVKARR